jgi:hypothetical protein
LVSITFLPHVNDLNVALLNSLRQTLVQAVVHIIQVEVWVMKDLLDKLFDGLQGRKSKSIGSIGSNMLKYTRDTFLWFAEYSGPWQQLLQRVQLKKRCGSAYHTRPCPSVMTACIGFCALCLHRIFDVIYDIIYYDIICDITYDITV